MLSVLPVGRSLRLRPVNRANLRFALQDTAKIAKNLYKMLFFRCFDSNSPANLRFAEWISLSRRLSLTLSLFLGYGNTANNGGVGFSPLQVTPFPQRAQVFFTFLLPKFVGLFVSK